MERGVSLVSISPAKSCARGWVLDGRRWVVGAGVGDSVASVNVTFFSSHDLRSLDFVRAVHAVHYECDCYNNDLDA